MCARNIKELDSTVIKAMGGFKLIGEKYVIQSTAPVVCYCQGFVGEIDGITERRLASKSTKVLDPHEDLPVPLRGSFLRHHIPDDHVISGSPPRC